MKDLAIVSLIEGLKEIHPCLKKTKIVSNIVKSAIFQAKIHTNGKKQIRIKAYTTNFHVFVCNGGHDLSSKEFEDTQDFKFSKFKIRIENKKPVLIFGDKIIYDFLNVPIQPNVIYWVSWKTKSNKTLRNRCDVFCLLDGELTNKIISTRNKINKKYQKNWIYINENGCWKYPATILFLFKNLYQAHDFII
jgi:hypothetical protein